MRPWLLVAAITALGAVPGLPAAPPELASAEDVLAQAKQVLAPLDGELAVTGLRAPVEVLRDRWGVAHIYAANDHDLFLAQGFVAAQDRLFQIDLWRRQAAGEMAEAFGPEYVAADEFARLMKYRGDPDAEWASYAPDARAIAAAFTDGINAAIDQFGDRPPVEFQILGLRPKKWRPEDVLGRMSGIYMSQNFRTEVQRARLVAAVGAEKAHWLAPVDPPRDYAPALSANDLKGIDPRILAGYEAATKALSFRPPRTESNNWVVAGARSASGKPLLASDPHRAIALPSLRYLVHLRAPGWDVIGSGEPALPGVAIGHNERIAWGFTIANVDQADFFVEEVNPHDPDEYRFGDRWEKMTVIREVIAVKGEKERPVELRSTRHGPVLFADVDGDIGWVVAARTPVRPRHDGLLPVPGSGGYEWSGHLPLAELPQSFNPPAGWLATANHNILPPGYLHTLGYEFTPPYRIGRIRQVLTSKERWNLDDFRALQHDVLSLPGLALARLLKDLPLPHADLEPYRQLLVGWDGRLTVDAPAGPLYALWLRMLQESFHALQVPQELRAGIGTLSGLPVMLEALEKADPRWFGPDAKAARDRLLRETFAQAVDRLKTLPAPQRQRWGGLHTITFRHPLSTLDPALARAFDLGPVERPGDGYTPLNTRYDDAYRQIHGATYRHLFDLADWDRGLATSTPGQSGQPGSPHYADLLPLWAKGEYFPLAFSRKKVDEVTQHRLMLRPR